MPAYAPQLLADTTLSTLMQNKLAQLSPMDNAALTNNVWRFQFLTQTITVDFTLFEQASMQFAETVTFRFDGQYIPLNLIEFAKLIWLDMASTIKMNPNSYYQIIEKLALLFHYLHSQNLEQLDSSDLVGFYGFCLTQNVNKDGIKKRLAAPAYAIRFQPLNLKKLKQILNRYGVTGVIAEISERKMLYAFN